MARTVGSSGAATRVLIVEAASTLFSTKTYAGTSLRDIAESVGMSKAALYYHFPSKGALLDAMFTPIVGRFEGIVADSTLVDGSVDRLALIEKLIEVQCQHFVLVHALAGDPSIRTVLRNRFHFERILSGITRALVGSDAGDASGLMRARCAMGAVAWTIRATADERIKTSSDGQATPQLLLTSDEREVILTAAADVLGLARRPPSQ